MSSPIQFSGPDAPNVTSPELAFLREAVVEAALRGLRPARRRSRRNPLHVPNPQRDAATFFVARCKDVADSFAQHGAAYLVAGNTHQSELNWAIRFGTAARDALTEFLEACDARRAQ